MTLAGFVLALSLGLLVATWAMHRRVRRDQRELGALIRLVRTALARVDEGRRQRDRED